MNTKMTQRNLKTWMAAIALAAVFAVGGYFALGDSKTRSDNSTSPASALITGDTTAGVPRKSGLAAADKDGDGIVYQDGMHPWIVLDTPGPSPDCGMELTPVHVDASQDVGTVRIDPVTLQNSGVRTAQVTVEPLARAIRTTGRIKMDEQGEHAVTLKVAGWIEALHADYNGAIVQKGQPLLEIYSPELVSTQEEYLLALRNVRRLEGSAAADDASRLLEATRRRLGYWDLSEEQIHDLEETGVPQRTVTFFAPSSGEVMRKQVSRGDYVEAGQKLMDIVDISENWLIVDVYEQDLAWIKVGTLARVQLPYRPEIQYESRVDYIYHMLDMATRSAEARITLPGGHHSPIKPGMYATVYLVGEETQPTPVVPEEAVIRTGDEEVVIVALGEGRFRPVRVRAGLQTGGVVQILEGLEGGETVVTSAQFLIDSEARLQSSIGAMMAGMDMTDAEAAGQMNMHEPDPSAAESDIREIAVTIGPEGFDPQEIVLEAGTPARLVFTRTTDETCATQIQIPAFGIDKTDLPKDVPVAIEIVPQEDGEFTFACGMDMLKGVIVVKS